MAARKWFHVYHVVSFGSDQFGEYRTGETVFVLVRTNYLRSQPRDVISRSFRIYAIFFSFFQF